MSNALAPSQRQLLAGGEEQLDPDRGGRSATSRRGRREDHGDGRLVVGAEDRLVGVAQRRRPRWTTLTGAGERHGVEVRAEQDRAARPPGPSIRASRLPESEPVCGAAAVLLDLEPERAQLGGHGVGHGALAPRRALDLAQADEIGDQPLALAAERRCGTALTGAKLLAGAAWRAAASRPWTRPGPPAPRPERASRARSSAAPTNSRNSGCGRSGRDLNSGWYCDATKNGWSGSSMTSTRRSSGEVPQKTSPACSSRLRRWLLTS